MKKVEGGRAGQRKGLEVDEPSGGAREGGVPRRGGNRKRDAEAEKTTTAASRSYTFSRRLLSARAGISKVKIKIKMRCRG